MASNTIRFLLFCGVLVVAGGLLSPDDKPSPSSNSSGGTTYQAASVGGASRSKMADLMPSDQRALIAAVERGREAYRAGANDLAKGATRPARAAEICRALGSFIARQWVGRVSTLSSNSDGKGVLGIEIAKDIHVTTWNNALSDISDGTLIEPGTALMMTAANLRKGQAVVFSGSFVRGSVDCIGEQSVTLSGSMTDPEFTFRFSSIEPAAF